MGENRAIGQSILGGFTKEEAYFVKDGHRSFKENLACLHSFDVDKFKYVQGKAFDYNKCKFRTDSEAALMIGVNREKEYGI
jgi:hypothetical protein